MSLGKSVNAYRNFGSETANSEGGDQERGALLREELARWHGGLLQGRRDREFMKEIMDEIERVHLRVLLVEIGQVPDIRIQRRMARLGAEGRSRSRNRRGVSSG